MENLCQISPLSSADLRSNAFSFWPVRSFGGSSTVVTFALVYAQEYPAFVLVHAAAGQPGDFLFIFGFVGFRGFGHFGHSSLSLLRILS